jgi:hypothetical protein
VLFAALSQLPDRVGAVLWRLLGAGVYLAALGWWARTALPRRLTGTELGLLFLLVVPFSLSSLNNGQANLLLAGLLLAGVTAAGQKRWGLVSCCLVLACLFKLYPLAVALLLLAVFPRQLALRFPLALAAGLAVPFLLQPADYAARQYVNWVTNLYHDDRSAYALDTCYRDMWQLCRLWHLPVGRLGYLWIQLAAAALAAAVCLAGRWAGWTRPRLLTTLLALGSCWMILFGPATESCTYVLLAPSLAWAVLESWEEGRPAWARGGLAASYGLLLAAFLAGWFPFASRVHALGLHPMGALIFLTVLLGLSIGGLRRPALPATTTPSSAHAA